MSFCQVMMEEKPDVVAAIMTQLSLKSGLKEWGKKADKAVHSEMKQLHFRNTFKLIDLFDLDDTQKRSLFESHIFLNKK